MRSSSSFLALSTVAILSTALLLGLNGTAMSQTATGSAPQLPSITVEAPKQLARPAQAAAGGKHGCISPEIASRCNAIDFASCHTGGARYNHGRSLPRSRKSPTIATMVAKQVSSTATNPGMDARCRAGFRLLFRQRAETCTTTKPMLSARTPDCFWVGITLASGGIAAACWPGGSWPGRRFRSPNSSDQDVASSYRQLTSGDVTRRSASDASPIAVLRAALPWFGAMRLRT